MNSLRKFAYLPGFRTNRKLLVIESDDWGSVRMPNKQVFLKMKQAGIPVESDLYYVYDTLESPNDLTALFEVLLKFKDINGRNPIITANTILSNPDFERIQSQNFEEYHFELFTKTLERYYGKDASLVWKQGVRETLFKPQFHGREHFNVIEWMSLLREKKHDFALAFENEMFCLPMSNQLGRNVLSAYSYANSTELQAIKHSIKDGLDLFNSTFGFKSQTSISPRYIWDKEVEQVMFANGIVCHQGIAYQQIDYPNRKSKRVFHYMGQKNKLGQNYSVRNAFFEPTLEQKTNTIETILSQIEFLFTYKKPVILSTHRINFMGSIDESNRTRNLQSFKSLLAMIQKKWPDIEFIDSEELSILIRS